MAFSDFDTVLGSATGSIVGGLDGSQQVNASLASPLTLQGLDSRVYEMATDSTFRHDLRYMIDNGAHPDFTTIPDTKAISVRAWVRKEAQFSAFFSAIYIHAKGSQLDVGSRVSGYFLTYGRGHDTAMLGGAVGSYTGLSLGIRGTAPASTMITAIDIATLAVNTWHQIRLDVIPTLNGSTVDRDTIRAYHNTGTEASPIWTLLHEEVVLLTSPSASPWSDATHTRVGFGMTLQDAGSIPNNRSVFIDGFEAFLKDR